MSKHLKYLLPKYKNQKNNEINKYGIFILLLLTNQIFSKKKVYPNHYIVFCNIPHCPFCIN